MLQQMLYLIPWLIIASLLLIPLLCFLLYRRRKVRVCLLFSHLWCMIAFCVVGLFLSDTVRHHAERWEYSEKARKLLEITEMLREGDTQNAVPRLDDFLAGTLHRTASDG